MKKYYNEKGEQFRLEKGTLQDLREKWWTKVYLVKYEGKWHYSPPETCVNYYNYEENEWQQIEYYHLQGGNYTTKYLAYILDYCYDENGKEYSDVYDII